MEKDGVSFVEECFGFLLLSHSFALSLEGGAHPLALRWSSLELLSRFKSVDVRAALGASEGENGKSFLEASFVNSHPPKKKKNKLLLLLSSYLVLPGAPNSLLQISCSPPSAVSPSAALDRQSGTTSMMPHS